MDNKGPKSGGAGSSGKVGPKESMAADTKPGFLKQENKGKKQNAASMLLGNNEKNLGPLGAGDGDEDEDGALGEARSREAVTGGLYSGVGKSITERVPTQANLVMQAMKNKGPLGAIIIIIMSVGAMMGGSQSLMPMAIEEMIVEKLNSIGISSTMTSDAMLNLQLNQDVNLTYEPTEDTASLFAFSQRQVDSFEKVGMKLCSGVGAPGMTTTMSALLFKESGQWIPVIGSDMAQYPAGDVMGAVSASCGVSNVGTPLTVSEAMQHKDFKVPYTKASKAWRGGVSGWFDKTMESLTQTKLSINRNRWTRYVTSSLNDITNNLEKFKETAKTDFSRISDDGVDVKAGRKRDSRTPDGDLDTSKYSDVSQPQQVGVTNDNNYPIDADGNPVPTDSNGVPDTTSQQRVDVSEDKLNVSSPTVDNISKVLNSKAVKAAAAISEYACSVLQGLLTVYTTVSAFQRLQFLNLISGYLEAVDKVKAGEGDKSPIHEYSNNLTTTSDTVDNETGNVTAAKRSAMMSVGIGWFFNMSNGGGDDTSVKNINFENIMSNLSRVTSNVELSANIYEKCGYVKAGVAVIDLATTILSVIPIIGQGIKAVQLTIKAVGKIAIKAAVMAAFYIIIPIATRYIAKALIKDAATDWFGEDLGNALASGASMYLGGNATSGGMSPGGRDEVIAYMSERDAVIADEAEYQRSVRSPFDVTSHYTFLGSIMYSLIPFAYSSSGIMSTITNMSTMVSNSAVAMLPTASAWGINDELTPIGNCALLDSVGVAGDLFCNPYIIEDINTAGVSPVAIDNIVHNIKNGGSEIAANSFWMSHHSDNFEADGSVKKGSNLSKHLLYCDQRVSTYGLPDLQIASDLTGNNTAGAKILSYVPIVNSIKDLHDGIVEEKNMAWTNGRACNATRKQREYTDVKLSDGSYYQSKVMPVNELWEENQYYQRWEIQQRWAENIRPEYTSPATAFVENYYKENPLDNSFEGTIARFSGQTVEDVDYAVALLDYFDFLENYNPSERYAFGQEVKPAGTDRIKFDNDYKVAYVVLLNTIEFADVRNRSFVV